MQQYLPIFLLQFVLSTIIKICHPLTKSNVIVAIDDYFLKFTINGVGVDLESFRDLGNWVTIKRFSLYLSEGDELLFEGMNNHDALSNPRGMAIQIEFVKKNGEITVYKTGNGWTCDGKPAIQKANLSTATNTFQYWKNAFPANTMVIWGQISNRKSICKFTIPKQ